jgi:hypothetical protein
MKTKVTIEIEIPVTYQVNPGEPATFYEPGEPACIEDLDFDEKAALKAIEKALESREIEDYLFDEYDDAQKDYEFQKAEFLSDKL